MVHAERLRAALEYIVAHPEEWDQDTWGTRIMRGNVCQTSHCLAGHAVVLNGDDLAWVNTPSFEYTQGTAFTNDGMAIKDRAAEILGLSFSQSRDLFSSTNSLRRLWALASRLTDGEIQVPEDLP